MLMEQVSRLNDRIRDLHEELSEQVAELDKEI